MWGESDPRLTLEGTAFTPGVGFRYATPIGPIRIDLAYRGTATRELPVVTSQIRPFDAELGDKAGDRIGPDESSGLWGWVRRGDLALLGPKVTVGTTARWYDGLQLHFSIGQAF